MAAVHPRPAVQDGVPLTASMMGQYASAGVSLSSVCSAGGDHPVAKVGGGLAEAGHGELGKVETTRRDADRQAGSPVAGWDGDPGAGDGLAEPAVLRKPAPSMAGIVNSREASDGDH
jgi:hypothetical protein